MTGVALTDPYVYLKLFQVPMPNSGNPRIAICLVVILAIRVEDIGSRRSEGRSVRASLTMVCKMWALHWGPGGIELCRLRLIGDGWSHAMRTCRSDVLPF